MILLKLYDPAVATSTVIGSENPLYVCDIKSATKSGQEVDNQFYYPAILNSPKFNWSGKNYLELGSSSAQIDTDFATRFTSPQIEVTAWLWDKRNPKFLIFDGVGIKGKFDSIQYTYNLKDQDYGLNEDLLSLAPDLKNIDSDSTTTLDKRVYPIYFGYVKYTKPLQLAKSCASGCGGTYYAGSGKALKLADAGIPVKFTQSTTTIRKTTGKPIYEITTDINALVVADGSDTTTPDVFTENTTFSQATEPTAADYVLKNKMIWVDISDNNKTYIYSNGSWVEITPTVLNGLQIISNGTDLTATRLIISGARISSQASVTATNRLNFDTAITGATGNYVWNTTNAEWDQVASLGATDGTATYTDNYVLSVSEGAGDKDGAFIGAESRALYAASNTDIAAQISSQGDISALLCENNGNASPMRIAQKSTAPTADLQKGCVYFDGTTNKLRVYDGTSWINLH